MSSKMEVPSLSDMSLGAIATNLWLVHGSVKYLVGYIWFEKDTKKRRFTVFKESLKESVVYNLDNITYRVLDMSIIPRSVAIKISVALLHLARDVIAWGRVLSQALEDIDNLYYCLEKTVFTSTGRVDRPKSFTKSMFDSFGRIDIKYTRLILHTLINAEYSGNYLLSISYKYKEHFVKKTKKLLKKMDINTIARKRDWPELFTVRISACGNLDVLHFWYNTIQDQEKTKWICSVFSFMLKCKEKNNFPEKVIYIYDHVEDDIWEKILTKYYLVIILELFLSENSEYCLTFYKQITRMQPDTCKDILELLFREMSVPSDYCCGKLLMDSRVHTILTIWNHTNPDLKNGLYKSNVFRTACAFAFKNGYNFVSLLVKDSTHGAEERKELIHCISLYNMQVLDRSQEDLKKLYDDFEMEPPKYTNEQLKSFVMHHAQMLLYNEGTLDHVFENEDSIEVFKREIARDPEFVIETINKFNWDEKKSMASLHNFMVWCFPDKDDVLEFITEHLLKADVMIEIYCLYLYVKTNPEMCPLSSEYHILDHVFRDTTVASEIKDFIVNASDFIPKSLSYIMNKDYESVMPIFLEYICTENEKETAITAYLISDAGLKDVLAKYVYTDSANSLTQTESGVRDIMKFNFLFNHFWAPTDEIREMFATVVTTNANNIYIENFKEPAEENLLPHESIEQHKTVINNRYKLFLSTLLENDFMFTIYNSDYIRLTTYLNAFIRNTFTLLQ